MVNGRKLDGFRLYTNLLGTYTKQTAALILGSIREIDERKDDCGEQLFTLLTTRFQQLGEAYATMEIKDFCMLLRDDMFLQKFGTKYRKYGILKSQITATDLQGEDILSFLRRMADRRKVGEFGNNQRGNGRFKAGENAFLTTDSRPRIRDKDKPCFNMVNNGTCSFGNRCKYSHDAQVIKKYKEGREEANTSTEGTSNPTPSGRKDEAEGNMGRPSPQGGIDDFFEAMFTEVIGQDGSIIDLDDAGCMNRIINNEYTRSDPIYEEDNFDYHRVDMRHYDYLEARENLPYPYPYPTVHNRDVEQIELIPPPAEYCLGYENYYTQRMQRIKEVPWNIRKWDDNNEGRNIYEGYLVWEYKMNRLLKEFKSENYISRWYHDELYISRWDHDEINMLTDVNTEDSVEEMTVLTTDHYNDMGRAQENQEIIADTGATSHFITDDTALEDVIDVSQQGLRVNDTHGRKSSITKVGRLGDLKTVKFAPNVRRNLFSPGQYLKENPEYCLLFHKNGAYRIRHNNISRDILEAKVARMNKRNLFVVDPRAFGIPSEDYAYVAQVIGGPNRIMELHRACNHVGLSTLNDIAKQMDITFSKDEINEFKHMVCDGCLGAKITAKNHPAKPIQQIRVNRRVHPLERVHMDIMYLDYPCDIYHYILVIVDHSTRWSWTYLLMDRAVHTVLPALETFINTAEQQSGTRVKELFSDNEPALTGQKVKTFCRSRGIIQTFTVPGHSIQNGIAENRIRKIRVAGNALWLKVIPKNFMGYAYLNANSLWNITPQSALGGRLMRKGLKNHLTIRNFVDLDLFCSYALTRH